MNDLLFSFVVWSARVTILAVLCVVLYKDSVARRIPNFLVLLLLTCGLLFNYLMPPGGGLLTDFLPGSLGLKTVGISISIVLGGGFLLYLAKLWGAGDAKLLAGLASWIDWRDLPAFVVSVALMGGVLVLFRTIKNKSGMQLWANLQILILSRLSGSNDGPLRTVDHMPFSWAIAGGWLMFMIIKMNGITV
jgi:Flp pilus assembly protein protease CpaA